MEQGLTRQRVFSELAKSPHGKLEEYLPTGQLASRQDPEFFAHLVAWNARKGEVRDSKVALPLIALDSLVLAGDPEFRDNALAHLAKLAPRDLIRGVRFAKDQKLAGRRQAIPKLVAAYLHSLEENMVKWERVVVQHRRTMQELYALCHVKPGRGGDAVRGALFGEDQEGQKLLPVAKSMFEVVANLKNMPAMEAAGEVIIRRIPFLVAAPALGAKLKDPAVLSAVMARMTPAELTSHMKMLERLGVRKDPVLRAALEGAMVRLATGKSSALKLSKALEQSERDGGILEDEDIREKLLAVQEKKLDKSSVKGNWLVLGDMSGSMRVSIELAKQVASVLARMAEGQVNLVFFNTSPQHYDVTGKSLEDVVALTRRVVAIGGTSIGCGLRYAVERGFDVDGIAVVSDGGENTAPAFASAYAQLSNKLDRSVPVYFYKVPGDPDSLTPACRQAGIELQEFPIGASTDYYSIPNMVQTMRTNRYSLIDEVMATRLLRVSDVLGVDAGGVRAAASV